MKTIHISEIFAPDMAAHAWAEWIGPPTPGSAAGQELSSRAWLSEKRVVIGVFYCGEQASTKGNRQHHIVLLPDPFSAWSRPQGFPCCSQTNTMACRYINLLWRVLNREWVPKPTPPQLTLCQSTRCIWYGQQIYTAQYNNCVQISYEWQGRYSHSPSYTSVLLDRDWIKQWRNQSTTENVALSSML